jgi:hypothetical protein
MAIQSVKLLWADMGGEADEKGIKTYSQTYRVISDDPFETRVTVGSAAGIPPKYSLLAEDTSCWCRHASIARIDASRLVWLVTVEFSNAPQEKQEEEKNNEPNPLLRPARVRWTSSIYQQAVEKDINGKAILNSAGDYFDPPPEVDRSRWAAHVSKNYASLPEWLLDYADALNDAPFKIGGLTVLTGKAKLSEMAISELQKENDTEFYELSFSIQFRKEGWVLKMLDQGLHYLTTPDDLTTKTKIKINGEDAAAPVLLDGHGGILADPSPTSALFLGFDEYEAKNFLVLPGCSAVPP